MINKMATVLLCTVILSMPSMMSSHRQQHHSHPDPHPDDHPGQISQRNQQGKQTPPDYSIRLVTDSTKRSGKVEQLVEQIWKPVCGDTCWTNETARVVCNELNFSRGISRTEDSTNMTGYQGKNTSGGYNCNGDEPKLHNCSKQCNIDGCSSQAQVTCIGAVRLNGEVTKRAAVEVFWKNRKNAMKWGGVCSECWSQNNTNVVCKQFGLRSGQLQSGSISNASQTIWEHVIYFCFGNETDLSDCPLTKEKCGKCGNRVIVKCRQDSDYNQTCTNDGSCTSGLVCKQTDNNVCKCENETNSFWNEDTKTCEERSDLGQKCALNINHSCRDTLVCKGMASNAVCKNGTDEAGTKDGADETQNLDYNQTCTNDESCTSGLVCKQTDNKVCKCENETNSFWNADTKTCEARSDLDQKCFSNIHNSCRDTLVCTGDTSSTVCKTREDDVWAGKEADDTESTVLWPSYVGIAIGILAPLSIIAVAVYCYKTKRRKKIKNERTVLFDNGQSSSSNHSIGIGENENGTPMYDLAQPVSLNKDGTYSLAQPDVKMNLGNDEAYSLAQSDVNSPSSGSKTQTTATDHYGYGLIGEKRADNDDNGMYSHTRRMNDTGEYDTFDKGDRDTDVNDVYDHTRGLTMENQYDKVQKKWK